MRLMGLYDYRCMATDLSLRGERAVAVLLAETAPGQWVPASLPVRGTYNGSGTVDGVVPDGFTELLVHNFARAIDAGRIVLTNDALDYWQNPAELDAPLDGIEHVLTVVERATTCSPSTCTFDGRPLCHALIHEGIYDAAVAALWDKAPPPALPELIARLLPCAAGQWLYQGLEQLPQPAHLAKIQALLGLAAFASWTRDAWVAGKNAGQHGDYETVVGYRDARRKFDGIAWLCDALERAARAAERRQRRRSAGWIRGTEESWYGLVPSARDRVAWTNLEGLRDQWKLTVCIDEPENVLGQPIELFVVQRGQRQPSVDARRFLRVTDVASGASVPLTDPAACEELMTRPRLVIELRIDEALLMRELPPLATPRRFDCAFLLKDQMKPEWLYEDERYLEVVEFGTLSG